MLIDHLKFQIDDSKIVQADLDIQNEGLVRERSTQFDGVGDFSGEDFFLRETKKGTDQALQNSIVLL